MAEGSEDAELDTPIRVQPSQNIGFVKSTSTYRPSPGTLFYQQPCNVWRQAGAVVRIEYMARIARLVNWNGKDVPPEMRELPAGRYIVEAVDSEAPPLSADQEAG